MTGAGNVEATEIYSERERQPANFSAALDLDLKGQTPDQFRKRVKETFPDLILPDGKLVRWRGMEALEILRRQGLDVPMILGGDDQKEESAQEELARKLIELARSNADLEQFANVASHDLQEPLRMVSTYTELIAEQYSEKLDAKADKYIHYAVDGSRRMGTLIRDLLEFARVGKTEGHLRNSDCEEVVKQVIADLQVAINETGAMVTFEHLPVVMARPFELKQVFQNLIGNAIKFHDGKPPSIHVSAELKERVWIFSVIDNGISIAPENVHRIFAVFQRLHTREEYPGNGIGLAICKKIVEQHGGTIWVEPNATPGATFKFTWPVTILSTSRNDSYRR
jgi:light-regulated signal transduction histidine kinase (bacteriophytochrome)